LFCGHPQQREVVSNVWICLRIVLNRQSKLVPSRLELGANRSSNKDLRARIALAGDLAQC
jgi:hypothetical protein